LFAGGPQQSDVDRGAQQLANVRCYRAGVHAECDGGAGCGPILCRLVLYGNPARLCPAAKCTAPIGKVTKERRFS